jgi:hypothetical protein
VLVAAAVLAGFVRATVAGPSSAMSAPPPAQLLDVPYVPQSGVLCGGAALAMVLRYWGEPGVLAEDFAALVVPGQAGITTGALADAAAARGWTSLSVAGMAGEVEGDLAEGRPVIALMRTAPGTYHFVVLVAWASGWVILHDPAVGPYRVLREDEFEAAWAGAGRWALLVLPPPEAAARSVTEVTATAASSPATGDGCEALVDAGVLLAQQGDTAAAELRFLAAQSLFPASASPLRERAGLRFRAEDWAGATRLAGCALALDPADAHAWRLLAGSRYLAGDVDGALDAWNHLDEPRTDLARIAGLSRVRYAAVAGQLALPPGRLLTPASFGRARRRLAEVPAQAGYRLGLMPLPAGLARVDVTLRERPLVFAGPWDAGRVAMGALLKREVVLAVASPTGNGELWTAGWRWQRERPRVSLALLAPAAGGRPGIWGVEGFWERQAYGLRQAAGRTGVTREERRWTALSFADWFGPDLRLGASAAVDAWTGRGTYLAAAGNAEIRWSRDRLATGAEVATWSSLDRRQPFASGKLSLAWSSSGLERRDAWQGLLGVSTTTAAAPLALWSGAGTGQGRDPLLRAHPLLRDGVVQGRVFGRALVHGTIERQVWPWSLGPVQIGWAIFADAAKAWDDGRAGRVPWQVDGGVGLRLRGLGGSGQVRIDAAHGFEDGRSVVSVGWASR